MEPDATRASADRSPASELEDAPARRTPAARLGRVGLAALVCLVAGGVLLHELASAPPRLGATPAPPGRAVLISNVSFGSVAVNGKTLHGPPPLVLPLRDGRNIITVTARPFVPKTCHVTWGAQGWVAGDCLATGLDQVNTIVVRGLEQHPSAVIVARFSGSDLPAREYDAARAVIEQQLAATSQFPRDVPPADPIATGGHWPDDIASRAAGPGVRATISFGLYEDASNAPHRQDCELSLCYGALFYTSASASGAAVWNAAPDTYYVWHFQRGAGEDASLPYPVSPPITLPLTYDSASGWQPLAARLNNGYPVPTDVLLDGTLCDAGVYALNALTETRGDTATVVGNSGMDGCVLDLKTQKLVHEGLLLWRFGVLLAADSEAHALLPSLPVATAAEVAAASK
jgi:hypothetical protein